MSSACDTKRPLAASRFTRIPSMAEDVSTFLANALVRFAVFFR
jgi:hypothetical protein